MCVHVIMCVHLCDDDDDDVREVGIEGNDNNEKDSQALYQ